jgi:hypothetical protein
MWNGCLLAKYERILALARPYLLRGSALIHTLQALKFASKLLRNEGGDPDVVMPTVILHDSGYSKVGVKWTQVDSGTKVPIHMFESARIAERILKETSFPVDKACEVIKIIQSHDVIPFPFHSIEAKVFKDADRLAGYFTPFGFSVIAKQKNVNEALSKAEEMLSAFLTSSGLMIAIRQLKKLKKKYTT